MKNLSLNRTLYTSFNFSPRRDRIIGSSNMPSSSMVTSISLIIIREIDVTIDDEGMLDEPIILSLRGEKLKEVYKVLFRDKFFIVSTHTQDFHNNLSLKNQSTFISCSL